MASCPVCGIGLSPSDNYCRSCGSQLKKSSKKKKKNILLIVAIIIIFYASIRYFNGQAIIPVSLVDALNFSVARR